MNHKWIENRIHKDDFANLRDFHTVREAVRNGDYEAVLSRVDVDGTVKHFRLDIEANIIGEWP